MAVDPIVWQTLITVVGGAAVTLILDWRARRTAERLEKVTKEKASDLAHVTVKTADKLARLTVDKTNEITEMTAATHKIVNQQRTDMQEELAALRKEIASRDIADVRRETMSDPNVPQDGQ